MLVARLLLSAGVIAAAASAQSAPCLSFNDATNNASTGTTFSPFVGQNPNSRAFQFSPASAIAPLSASIFTGSPLHDDYMRLEIWDEDPATQAPGTRLAVGTFFSPMSATASWLGTNFDTAPTLNPGTNYWLVWIESGASYIPEEPGGTPLPRRMRSSSNPWGSVGSAEAKFRLYCGLLDTQIASNFGAPCASSGGQLVTALSNDAPTAGNAAYAIEGNNLPPGMNAWMLIGVDPNATSTPLGPLFPAGCSLHTDIIAAVSGVTGIAEIGDQPTTPRPSPFGHVRFALPLTTVNASGVYFSAQLIGMDGGSTAAIPLVLTNAIRVVTQ